LAETAVRNEAAFEGDTTAREEGMAGRKDDATDGAQSESAQQQPCYDVFISYSSKDKTWVRGELLTRIEQAGLKAIIDFRDFPAGQRSVKEIERAILTCRKTLAVLTPDYFKSEWCDQELTMVETLDPGGHGLRLIPLLKTKCEEPLRVRAVTHIDFTDGADLDLAWRQLLTALGAPPVQEPPKEPERGQWFLAHPYPMPPNFTGRMNERKVLSRWLETDATHPLLVLRALGGFGKSALVWHWLLHDVAPDAWPRVVWWSFYEGDSSFDHFLAESLDYLSDGKVQAERRSGKNAVVTLVKMLHAPGTLLVLDGFERELRAFGGLNAAYQGDEAAKSETNECDCVSPLADLFLHHVALQPNLRSKVLLTTRLRPHVLEAKGGDLLQGSREEELNQMQPADAVEFFHAQGIRGTRAEIEAACDPYGYHPLSLRLLAGWIVSDLQQPGDIVAANRLDVNGDLIQRQHHVLQVAYDSLTADRQRLLGRIACFRTPVTYDTLKALAETPDELSKNLDGDLRDLVARGLLHHDTKKKRFDLHPIVRRYAYDRLAAPDRTAAHTRLRDYFAAVPQPDKVTCLEDLGPVIELYHHTVRAARFDEAFELMADRFADVIFYRLGAYQTYADLLGALFPDGEDCPPRLKKRADQAWAMNSLANCYSKIGQPRRALPLRVLSVRLDEDENDERNLVVGLVNLAAAHRIVGALRAAETNLHRSVSLRCQIRQGIKAKYSQDERFWSFSSRLGEPGRHDAILHEELGQLLAYRGAYRESEIEFDAALNIKDWSESPYGLGVNSFHRTQRELLLLRSITQSEARASQSATVVARRALELADEDAHTDSFVERDYVRAHWVLGAAHRVAGQHDKAERHLHEALQRCRRINDVEHEADILIDLARLRGATGSPEEAQRLVEEALLITERSGYVLQGADAHLELAKLAFARGDKAVAKEHAEKAKELATCDGPPDYTYKAAYDEACALPRQ